MADTTEDLAKRLTDKRSRRNFRRLIRSLEANNIPFDTYKRIGAVQVEWNSDCLSSHYRTIFSCWSTKVDCDVSSGHSNTLLTLSVILRELSRGRKVRVTRLSFDLYAI